MVVRFVFVFFFKQKTAYEMRISDWSSDVCSSDLWQRRAGRVVAIGCAVAAGGLLLIWARAAWVAAPVLAYPVTTEFSALVESVEPLPARDQVRLIVRPQARAALPPGPEGRRGGNGWVRKGMYRGEPLH